MTSVRRLLQAFLALGVIAIALVGLLGTIATLSSSRTVNHMVDDLAPASLAGVAVRADMLQAGAAVRAFAMSGDQAQVAAYRAAVNRVSHTAEPLLRYLQSDVEVARRWQALSLAWEAWKTGYAEIRVKREGGPGTYDAKLYREGAVLFDRVQRTSAELNDALSKSSAEVRADTNARLNASLGLIAATALIGFLVLAIVGRWIARGVHTPLQDLQDTVARLRAGDDTARAATSGPAEISTLAEAVNELAEANTRARQVEHRVIQELRQIDTAKSEFVSNVSHELRTPLTIIDGYLELLDDEGHGELNAEQRGMLAVTRRNVARLRALIEDLLTLNRAEHNGTTLELIDIAAVVAAAVGDMGFNAANRDVSVELTKPADPVLILGDSGQLHRAVLNLVSNAVKFSERYGAVRVGGLDHCPQRHDHRRRRRDGHPEGRSRQAWLALLPRLQCRARRGGRHRPGSADRADHRAQPPGPADAHLRGGRGYDGHAAAAPGRRGRPERHGTRRARRRLKPLPPSLDSCVGPAWWHTYPLATGSRPSSGASRRPGGD